MKVHDLVKVVLILYGVVCALMIGVSLGLTCTIFVDFHKEDPKLRAYGLTGALSLTCYLVYQWWDLMDNWDRYFELEDWREEDQPTPFNSFHAFLRRWGRVMAVITTYVTLMWGSYRGYERLIVNYAELDHSSSNVTVRLFYGSYFIWISFIFFLVSWTFSTCFVTVLRAMGTPTGKKLRKRIESMFTKGRASSGDASSSDPTQLFEVNFFPDGLMPSGKLGVCGSPGRSGVGGVARVMDELTTIKHAHRVDVLVNLMELEEMRNDPIRLGLLSQSSEVFGADRVLHFPIRDNWIPTSMFRLVKLASKICDLLKEGKTVVIHCSGGKGRAPLVTAAVLLMMRRNYTPTGAITRVQSIRRGALRNPLQIIYLAQYEEKFRALLRRVKSTVTPTASK